MTWQMKLLIVGAAFNFCCGIFNLIMGKRHRSIYSYSVSQMREIFDNHAQLAQSVIQSQKEYIRKLEEKISLAKEPLNYRRIKGSSDGS